MKRRTKRKKNTRKRGRSTSKSLAKKLLRKKCLMGLMRKAAIRAKKSAWRRNLRLRL